MVTYFGSKTRKGGAQEVFKRYSKTQEVVLLFPKQSQKLCNHSPDGFQWGSPTARRVRSEIGKTLANGQFSYKSSGDFVDAIVGHWNFMKIEDVMIENANMDDIKRHSKFSSEPYLTWNVSIEFNGSIHQYSFAIKSSDKINVKLIAASRHIGNGSEPLSRQVSISSDYLGKSTSLATTLTIEPGTSCSPHFPLETEPFPLNPKVFILSPSIVASLATKGILVGTPCFAIDSIGQWFNNHFVTKDAFNTLWHIILLTFYLYYITNNPIKTSQGPAQLALALLLDATGDAEKALRYYQQFKDEYVALWLDRWEITRDLIREWVKIQEKAEEKK